MTRRRALLPLFVIALCVASLFASAAAEEPSTHPTVQFQSPWPTRVEKRANLRVTIGPVRTIARGVRSPLLTRFDNGTILLSAGSSVTGALMIRSEDRGYSWRPQAVIIAHLNTLELSSGALLVIEYNPKPIPDRPGFYRARRWTSKDQGRTLEDAAAATLHLPPDRFDSKLVHWLHGNLVELPSGDILTVMQGEEVVEGKSTWRCFLVRSRDRGENWEFVSIVADHRGTAPIRPKLQQNGWKLHGPVEPTLIRLDNGKLICIARTVDDESNVPESQYSPPSDTYHDLSYTVPGDGIHPGMTKLPADKYYTPGPASAPLIIMTSTDDGRHWTPPAPMRQARGCFPRTALSDDGILALTYGGLGTPRWGNCITFSTDSGRTWTDEINFGPFLTTGYTGLVTIGPGKFLAFFDCTPPQPWKNDLAWWIGVVDIDVKKDQL